MTQFKAGVIDGPGVLTLPTLTMQGDFKSGVLVRGPIITGGGARSSSMWSRAKFWKC